MDEPFAGWRRTCGIGTLLAALILTGAWAKSAVDHVVIPGSLDDQVGDDQARENKASALHLSGKIAVFNSTNPFQRNVPQINWCVRGLYTDAICMSGLNTGAGVKLVMLELPPPDLSVTLPDAGGAIEDVEGGRLSAGRTAAQADQSEDDPETLTVQWQHCGFFFGRVETAAGDRNVVVLIPHWSIAAPLWLLSIVLLVGPRRGKIAGNVKHASVAGSGASAARPLKIESGTSTAEGFAGRRRRFGLMTLFSSLAITAGWRGKLALLTLFASLALTGGWIRSGVVTDLFNVLPESQSQLLLVSGKDGISCRYDASLNGGSGTRYRILTGPAHEKVTFRPTGSDVVASDWEFADSETLDGPPFEVALAENIPDGKPPFSKVTLTAGELAPTADSPLSAGAPAAPVVSGSGGADWVGKSFEWGGIYLSRGPLDTTVVVPYPYLLIPLSLLAAALLAGVRTSNSLPRAAGLIPAGSGSNSNCA